MALLRRLFHKKLPDGLVWVFERIYVFGCCITETSQQEDFKVYVGNIISQFKEIYPKSSIMILDFREDEKKSRIDASILSEYEIAKIDYPPHYEGSPLPSMEVIHAFLKSSENWLSVAQQNFLIMHSELGGWPVLAFMVAALSLYRKLLTDDNKALEMVHKQAPQALLSEMLPMNPVPSQLRYLHYILRRNAHTEWPPTDKALTLNCVIMRMVPDFDGKGGCCPIFRIYGRYPSLHFDKNPKLLFSTPRRRKNIRYYNQAERELVKIDVNCNIQGDVVLECISLHDDMVKENIMYRAMFNTAFIKSNMLMLSRDEIDIYWDAKDQFHKDFRAELLFSEMDTSASLVPVDLSCLEPEGLPVEAFAKVNEMFSNGDWLVPSQSKIDHRQIDHRRTYNCEIMLSKVKTPLNELMEHVLALDDTKIGLEMVDNFIKYCPTKEEMEQLKGYKGEKENLGPCEQFFLEMMKIPRTEAKLKAFSYKMQFSSKVSELSKNLNIVFLSVEQIRSSVKLRRVMQTILSLGNALNQGTARGAAAGFKLDSLLKLNETRARNNKMTLMHYLCKVLADKLPELLDFSKELGSLEPASKLQVKILAEEMQAIAKGLDKVIQERKASKKDGHVSKRFHKNLKKFLASAEGEVKSLHSLYSGVGKSVDALIIYFGEDPARCPYEQVISTLKEFVRLFNQSHEENRQQIEAEKKKAQKEAEQEKLKLQNQMKKESKLKEKTNQESQPIRNTLIESAE